MLTESDAAIVARDPVLPGLAVLLDNALLLAAVSKAQPQLNLVSTQVDYLRYKPKTNCLARIRLRAGSEESFAYAVACRSDANLKIGGGALLHTSAASDATVLLDEHIVVHRFPHDRRLSALRNLVEPGEVRRLLHRTAPLFSVDSSLRLRTLRYKPERRYVAQVLVSGRPTAALKLYASDAYQAARRAQKTVSGLNANCFAKCVGHSDSQAALLFEWVVGTSPVSAAPNGSPQTDEMSEAAAIIQRLHEQRATKLPVHTRESFLRRLDNQIANLAWLVEDSGGKLTSIYDRVAARMHDAPDPQYVPCHGDLHLEQIVVGERGSVLLDFDRACLAEPAFDLGHLWADWQTRDSEVSPVEQQDDSFDTLLQAYRSFGGIVDLGRIQAYAAGRLVELAGECFRCRRENWLHDLGRRIDKAIRVLDIPHIDSVGPHHSAHSGCSAIAPGHVQLASEVTVDQRLASVVAAIDPQIAKTVLRHVTSIDGAHMGIELDSIRILRHKAGRRCLIEYAGRSCSTGERIELLGKLDAKRRHQRYFERQRLLWNSGLQTDNGDGISVARPWGVVPEWQMWLQQKMPGECGWHHLAEPANWAAAQRVAQALAKLHRLEIPVEGVHRLEDELSILKLRLPIAASRVLGYRARIERLLDQCIVIADLCPPMAMRPIHRDFYPDQILMNGHNIVLVDFDLLCHGDPAVDVGNYRAHLIERSLRYFNHSLEYSAYSEVVTSEYLRFHSHVPETSIHIYTLLSLARLIWICTELPGRGESVVGVLEECERLASLF